MQYLWAHIAYILDNYDGKLPLTHWLKQYFKQHPKLGSRDRRAISAAIYAWYRCGKALAGNERGAKESTAAALYMTGGLPKALLDESLRHREVWPGSAEGAKQELNKGGWDVDFNRIFPFDIEYSSGIDKGEWIRSLLQQPQLFLRTIRPKSYFEQRLADVPHEWVSDTCLALPNATKLDGVLESDSYWVMDASSQATGEYYKAKPNERWWDCCSGAGGKSLLLRHLQPKVDLTVSDVRESILQNLTLRFRQYHLQQPLRQVLDASDKNALNKQIGGKRYDAIICDAPCTGSGTWARTPEGAYFFDDEQLGHYSERQKTILVNASDYAKAGGRIIYITCSVFRNENEDVVEYASKAKGLEVESSTLINGISKKADCLYVAVLRKQG